MAQGKKVTVTMDTRDEKKRVVKFSTSDENAAVGSVYLDNAADKKLGSPDEILVTITPVVPE